MAAWKRNGRKGEIPWLPLKVKSGWGKLPRTEVRWCSSPPLRTAGRAS